MVIIVADTTSGITPENAAEIGVEYIPQIIVFGENSYRDDNELDSITFLKMLAASSTLPKTAAPPPALYTPIFKKHLENKNIVIVICPSADLSGTFRSATIAAQDFPEADIRIIDTRTVAGGLGQIVQESARLAKAGKSADFIVNEIKLMATHEKVYFLVDTLEYLYKGGRIGGASALFGSILQVKPILTLKDGRIEAFEKQRSRQRALARLIDLVTQDYPQNENGFLSISHGNALDVAENLAKEFAQRLNITNIPIFNLPPAILVHAGPGVLEVSFFNSASR